MPETLLVPPVEKLSTGMNQSLRFLTSDRRNVVRILKSFRLEPTTAFRISPSAPPKGWLDTVKKPPSAGICLSCSGGQSYDIPNLSSTPSEKEGPERPATSVYTLLSLPMPRIRYNNPAASSPIGPFIPKASRKPSLLISESSPIREVKIFSNILIFDDNA